MRLIALALLAAGLSGCDAYHYHAGRFHEGRRRSSDALKHYEAFLAHGAADVRAAELHVRAGRIYAGLERCLEARRHYETAAREFPKLEPWAGRAKGGIMSCPDYFPLQAGRSWVYGDSASGGKAMRLEWQVRTSSGLGGLVTQSLYAGAKLYQSSEARYELADWTLWQRDKGGRFPLLNFPYTAGRSWTARRDGRSLRYRIESVDATARTAAGVFKGCLKIRETAAGFSGSWKYDYYCPSVGRALTTVAGSGFENPNTELLSYVR